MHLFTGGSQYTSVEFGSRLREEGLLPSMGSVADAYDNSMAESFISTLKRELIYPHSWPNRHMARTAIFEYIEGFYNTRRRYSALGNLSPREYEGVRLRGVLWPKGKLSVKRGNPNLTYPGGALGRKQCKARWVLPLPKPRSSVISSWPIRNDAVSPFLSAPAETLTLAVR